jgi:hypothetical protein
MNADIREEKAKSLLIKNARERENVKTLRERERETDIHRERGSENEIEWVKMEKGIRKTQRVRERRKEIDRDKERENERERERES